MTHFSQTYIVINYNYIQLNIGYGLDPFTDIFKIAVGGIYAFHFNSYWKDKPFARYRTNSDQADEVYVILNGIKLIGKTTSGTKCGSFSLSVVLSFISG